MLERGSGLVGRGARAQRRILYAPMHTHVEAREVSSFYHFLPNSLSQGLSLNLKVTVLASLDG